MVSKLLSAVTAMFMALVPAVAHAGAAGDLAAEYRGAGAGEFSASKGESIWNLPSGSSRSGKPLGCSSCHGPDLTKAGKHVETGEPIEPMAPSLNKKRLTDRKFIEKWFKRNCKEVYSRECTPQEKGDFLAFIGGK